MAHCDGSTSVNSPFGGHFYRKEAKQEKLEDNCSGEISIRGIDMDNIGILIILILYALLMLGIGVWSARATS